MRIALLAAVFALLNQSCTNQDSPATAQAAVPLSIVGGKVARPNTHIANQVVRLVIDSSACTGTFISRRLILTAAHCFSNYRSAEITVQLGADSNAPVFTTKGDKFLVNPYYRDDVMNDLALIRTKDPLPSFGVVTPLASKRYDSRVAVLAAGYGLDVYREIYDPLSVHSGHLKYVILTSPFQWWFSQSFEVDINDRSGISHGDSGGPLFILDNKQFVQIGVAHAIATDAAETTAFKAQYASVYGNLSWIKKAAQSLLQ